MFECRIMEGIQGNVLYKKLCHFTRGYKMEEIFSKFLHIGNIWYFHSSFFLTSDYRNGEIGNRLLKFIQLWLIKYFMKLLKLILKF